METKPATVVFHRAKVILECPHCGQTLIRTTYDKVSRLLDASGPPRGKICEKCGKTAIFTFDEPSSAVIRARTSGTEIR
ncbi:MAG: hypothetical protein LDL33_03305 [Desulfomonile sp.]|nr:hypothetical protein [Desulfomonile sp.]